MAVKAKLTTFDPTMIVVSLVIGILIVIACDMAVNAALMQIPQGYYAIAEDRTLPPVFRLMRRMYGESRASEAGNDRP
jgi:amino acid transporter